MPVQPAQPARRDPTAWQLAPLPTALKLRLCAAAKASWPGRLPVSLPVGNLAAVGFRPGDPPPTRSAAATRHGPA